MSRDNDIIRGLAEKTMEVAHDPIQDRRRKLWADVNSLRSHEVPVYVLDPQGMWEEACPALECEDPFLRGYENWLRLQLYHASFGDDFVTEKYVTMPPVMDSPDPNWRLWGIQNEVTRIPGTKAYHFTEILDAEEDIEKIKIPFATVNEKATGENMEKLAQAIGGAMPIYMDMYPQYRQNLSTMYAVYYGTTNLLYQLYDSNEFMHKIGKKFSEGVYKLNKQAESDGWFNSVNQTFGSNAQIQAMAYNHEIANPNAPEVVPMKRHWLYDCAQEFESVSPQMHEELLLNYMKPVYEEFGLLAYGCCENLTKKLGILMKIRNLRRVAVTPWADDEECASVLGDRYVVSWRPNPAEMITNGFDEERITRIVKRAKSIYEKHNCFWEVNLKDFLTVEHDIKRLENWVAVVRRALE